MTDTLTEQEPSESPPEQGERRQRFRVLAILVVGAVAALLVWLATRGDDESEPAAANAVAVSPGGLQAFVGALRQPVYWVGPRSRVTYEVTREQGQIRFRYLPAGAEVGTSTPYLTVGTYTLQDAYTATERAAQEPGAEEIPTRDGALAFYRPARPYSAFLAYPGSQFQVEVFHPRRGQARRLIASGRVAPVPGSPVEESRAVVVTEEELRAEAQRANQPIYWAGPDPDVTYELRRTPERWFYVRYVPRDAPPDSTGPYLTVGTYPVADAFAAVQGLARAEGAEPIELDGGGLAVANERFPRSVYLAYPDTSYQVEVFAPSLDEARDLVTSGRIVPVG